MTSYAHIRESEVRAALPVGAKLLNDEFTIVALGRFSPGSEGTYPSVEAILARDPHDVPFANRPYSTHTIVARCDSGGITAPRIEGFLIENGTYDLDLDAAKHSLDER